MSPVNEPRLDGLELEYVSECVRSGWVSSAGRFIDEFEESWASYCGRRYGIAVSSGTAALQVAVACLVTLGTESRLRRLPTAIAAATGAIVLAQPIGLMAQRHFTTTSDLRGLRIVGVTRQGVGARTVHKVETARDAA